MIGCGVSVGQEGKEGIREVRESEGVLGSMKCPFGLTAMQNLRNWWTQEWECEERKKKEMLVRSQYE